MSDWIVPMRGVPLCHWVRTLDYFVPTPDGGRRRIPSLSADLDWCRQLNEWVARTQNYVNYINHGQPLYRTELATEAVAAGVPGLGAGDPVVVEEWNVAVMYTPAVTQSPPPSDEPVKENDGDRDNE